MKRKDQPSAGELRAALHRVRRPLIAVGVFSAVMNLLMLTGPLFMMQVYDRVLSSRSSSTLVALFAVAAYMYLLMGLLDYVRGQVLSRAGAGLQAGLEERALDATLRAAETPGYDPAAAQGLRDLGQIQGLFASPAIGAMFDLPWVPMSLAIMFLFHPLLGWFGCVATILVVGLALTNQRMTRAAQAEAQSRAFEAEMRTNHMRGEMETVRGLGMVGALTGLWQKARDTALEAAMQASARGGAIGSATRAVRLLMQSAVLALGAWLALNDLISGGAIMAASIVLGRALAPMEQTVAQWPLIQRAMAARKTLDRLLTDFPSGAQPLPLPRPVARLEVSDLMVVPPKRDKPTLQRVSFTAEPGDVIAVIGPSASGKSTLARALVGLWPARHGEIRLGGAKLDQFDRDRLGRMMGYLPQRAVLFAGTVAQNIARFQPDAQPDQIVAAATAASAHDLILRLPEGYDTLLGNGGEDLSGGQRQRIGLARAFFGDPLVLVLDEPNASLDEPGVVALNRAINAAKSAGRIVFVMSHRPSALAEANKVLMIEGGTMRAFGPRDEVLNRVVRNPESIVAAVGGTRRS